MKRAYLALPGISFTSLMINLPEIAQDSRGSPVIYMDTYDYARFRGWTLQQKEKPKTQYLGLLYDELRRRGTIQLVDYSQYYPAQLQERTIDRVQSGLDSLSDTTIQQAAAKQADGYASYTLGEYQRPFRASLDDLEYADYRGEIERQQRRINRGAGNPREWNERLLTQYRAAFAICHRLNRDVPFNIRYIIGQGECSGLGTVLNAAPALDFRSHHPHAPKFHEVNLDRAAATREVLDNVSTIATEITGVQHDDWFLFGPHLALPEFHQIFTNTSVEEKVNGIDVESVVSETSDLLARLDTTATATRSVTDLKAEADWLEEEHTLLPSDKERLLDQLGAAVNLSSHSSELRDFAKSGRFSPEAVFLAASIQMDPFYRYNEDDVYRRAVTLKNRLEPTAATDTHIQNFLNRDGVRTGGENEADGTDKEWYELPDRWR